MPTKASASSGGDSGTIDTIEVSQESAQYFILGRTPVILNRMAEKARHELLFPRGPKNAAERATTLKHNPIDEFRASPYKLLDHDAPTYLAGLAAWFKRGMTTAALDLPGTRKTQIGRNLWVEGERIPLYGLPQLFMAVTRSADMARTPDVRTRAIVPEWALSLTVTYTVPLLNAQTVTRLLAAAGMICGIGDWRQEKGSGSYGQYRIVAADDPAYLRIVTTCGREAQIDAMEAPICYDDESAELLAWYHDELGTRRLRGTAPAPERPATSETATEHEEDDDEQV